MSIGEKIKDYLEANGIKQTFLAKNAGLTDSTVSAICIRGRSIDCIEYYKICKALNLPLDYFLKDED